MFKYLKEVLFLLGPEKKRLPMLVLFFLCVSLLDLIGISFVASYITFIASPENIPDFISEADSWIEFSDDASLLLIVASVSLLMVFLVKAFFGILVSRTIINFSIDQQIRLRTYLMKAYQSLPYEMYIERNSSEYIFSIQTLVSQYSNKVIVTGLKAISDGIVAVVVLGFLAWVDLRIFTLVCFLIGALLFGYDLVFKGRVGRHGRGTNTAATKIVQGLNEGIEGLKEIRILQGESFFYHKVKNAAESYGKNYALSAIIAAIPKYLVELVMVIFIISTVLISSFFEDSNQINLLSTLSLFGVASIRLIPIINVLSTALVQWRFNRDGVSRLYKDVCFLQLQSKLDRLIVDTINTSYKQFHSIKLNNIFYRYPGSDDDVIQEVNIELRSGESIGLIGTSGSGKSTLLDIFLGLLEPGQGCIEYNGKPLDNNLLSEWRSHVAYLPQQVFLTDDTLKRNIALGQEDKDISEKRVLESLEKAKLSNLLEWLPNGIDTSVGEKGVKLSGGQRQRVALARAFYHERDVLIMDESTSSLDDKTEKEIVKEIQLLKGSRTMIVIAHRLTTVQHCDRIYRLEKGRIISIGTPDEIL
jgi:ATP-binding cassette, subfamily B, bacterial PglK